MPSVAHPRLAPRGRSVAGTPGVPATTDPFHVKLFAHARNAHLTAALLSASQRRAAKASVPWTTTVVASPDPADVGRRVVYVVSFPQEVEWDRWPDVARVLYQVEQFPHSGYYAYRGFWAPFVHPCVVGRWDYTRANVSHYPPALRSRVTVVPFPPVYPVPVPAHRSAVPVPPDGPSHVLFYGHPNARREALMAALACYFAPRGVRVTFLRSVFGDALAQHVRHASVVLNLHYHPKHDTYLETYRLNELLAAAAVVVSEEPSDADKATQATYADSGVTFVPTVGYPIRTDVRGMLRLAVEVERLLAEPWRRSLARKTGARFVASTETAFAGRVGRGLQAVERGLGSS